MGRTDWDETLADFYVLLELHKDGKVTIPGAALAAGGKYICLLGHELQRIADALEAEAGGLSCIAQAIEEREES
jgi:hypothetical protein